MLGCRAVLSVLRCPYLCEPQPLANPQPYASPPTAYAVLSSFKGNCSADSPSPLCLHRGGLALRPAWCCSVLLQVLLSSGISAVVLSMSLA